MLGRFHRNRSVKWLWKCNPVIFSLSEFADECVIGRAIHRHEEIEEEKEPENPEDVDVADFVDGCPEDKDGTDTEGNG